MLSPVAFSALIIILQLASISLAQSSCSKSFTFNNRAKSFATCSKLSAQDATLAWSYDPANATLSLVFSGVANSNSGWVGWGINWDSPRMIGTNALVAFQASNGSNMLDYKLTAQTQGNQPLACTPIDLVVLDRAVDIQGRNMNLYALIKLPGNRTRFSHVWNRGSSVINFQPQTHDQVNDLNGRGTINIATGVSVQSAGAPHQKLKNAHGFLNAVGWGILLPLGAMSARYIRGLHDPGWFYLHVFCQGTGYVLGVIGWGIGLRLGSYSKGIVRTVHRNIGITLFVFATLQVLAIVLRPTPDHKLRKYWNIYHHTIGYLTLVLSFVNIYKGLDILGPKKRWRNAYTGILVVIIILCFVLELVTWGLYLKKRREEKQQKQNATNGRHGGVEL